MISIGILQNVFDITKTALLSCKVNSSLSLKTIDYAHDFFQSQPIKNASIFILCSILHDWLDEGVKAIMCQLRASVMPSTNLVIMERLPSFVCIDTTEALKIEGFNPALAPEPLLPNFCQASAIAYHTDILVSENHPCLILSR